MSTVRCSDIAQLIPLDNFRDAWVFLEEHELFQDDDGRSRFTDALRISVDTNASPVIIEVDVAHFIPAANLSEPERALHPRRQFIHDPWEREPSIGQGNTFEKAIISLACHIRDHLTSASKYDEFGRRTK